MGFIRSALVICLIVSGCDGRPSAPSALARVASITDGDTLVVDLHGRRVPIRLIGIDTPETVKPSSPVECFGPEASAFLASLLAPGTAVVVHRDIESRDHFGRLLAYVFRAADGLFVNREILVQGYARTLPIPPNLTYAREFEVITSRAQREGRGMWQCASVTS